MKCVDFGVFVNFFGSKDGLVHISQLAKGRVIKARNVVKEGQKAKVMGLAHREVEDPAVSGRFGTAWTGTA